MLKLATVHLAAAFAFSLALPMAALALSCGDTINEDTVMTADLTCSTNPALFVLDAALDMHGFSITCTSMANDGIRLIEASSVRNGAVKSCAVGVMADAPGHHTIQRMYASANNYGFQSPALSFGNKWLDNVAANNVVTGFDLVEGGAKVIGNTALDNSFDGFSIGTGAGSKIVDNISEGSGNVGLTTDSSGSLIKGNLIHASLAGGMLVTSPAKISDNVVTGAGGSGLVQLGGAKLNKNIILGSSGAGVTLFSGAVSAASNLVALNGTVSSTDHGFDVQTGEIVELEKNLIVGNAGRGISMLTGSGNSVAANIVLKNGTIGLLINATDSVIADNIFLGNPTADTTDLNVNCDNNTWTGNTIGQASNPCEQ